MRLAMRVIVQKPNWGWLLVLSCVCLLVSSAWLEAAPGSLPLAFTATKGDQTITLLGTIHAGNSKMYPLPQKIYDALSSSDAVAFEIDIDKETLSGMEDLLNQMTRLPEGVNLFDLLPSDTFFKLERVLNPYGIHLIERLEFEPWFFSLLIHSLPMASGQLNIKHGVESHLKHRRESRGKPMLSLETIEEQISYFRMGSLEDQMIVLDSFLQTVDTLEESMDDLFNAWKSGNASHFEMELNKLSDSDVAPMIKSFWEDLIQTRNRTMLARMVEISNDHTRLFVAVGTLHLVGPEGVVSGLQSSGFRVERLIYDENDAASSVALGGGPE